MVDWFSTLAIESEFPAFAVSELRERGFVVLPGAVPSERMKRLVYAYDAAAATAAGDDIRIGSASTRVSGLVNREATFDDLFLYAPLLGACCLMIGRPFKLSSMHLRTLQPFAPDQGLHVDVRRESADWPLVGFILMVDEFRPDNGATRFVPGSHRWTDAPEEVLSDPQANVDGQVLACGPAGSLLVFHGSTWHGHSANVTDVPRRSLQGAYIPRDGRAATDFAARMPPDRHKHLGPLARYLLQL